jgi:hypothetical protein
MLTILNNFIPPNNRIVLDCNSDENYLLIEKCGTKSFLDLTKRFPDRFKLLTLAEFLERKTDTLNVFLREPIGRYISGIRTQMMLYQIPESVFETQFDTTESWPLPMFDTHTMPQFWFLMRFGLDSTLKFKFVDLADIRQVHQDIKHLNTGRSELFDWLSDKNIAKINYAMTEDIVLYNQFLGKTATITEIISQISKEKQFFDEFKQYKRIIPYIN